MPSSNLATLAAPHGVELAAQRNYLRQLQERDFDFGLVVGEAFVRGIRDLGYRHPGTALDELVDNALQAGARHIHVVFARDPADEKLTAIGVVDDGHGMDAAMVRLAASWGGTHRENDRSGFGRYGYGLPSAAVSLGRRFSIYACPADRATEGIWTTTVDIDAISAGQHSVAHGRVLVPEAERAALPSWIRAYLNTHPQGARWTHGAAIVIDKLDRVRWKTPLGLRRHLLEHFGVTYRNFLYHVQLYVDGEPVQPIDPLFLTPGMLYYDLDEDRAVPLEPLRIAVPASLGGAADDEIRVRFAYLPATFGSLDKRRKAEGRNGNQRYRIMKDHLGIIVLRLGRQIDVVTRCPWTTFVNYDRYWNVELDFPSSVDEQFNISTAKQRVELSDSIWGLLQEAGVPKAIEQMRRLLKEERGRLSNQPAQPSGVSPAAHALQASRRGQAVDAQAELRQTRLEVEVRRRALETGRPRVEIERELQAEIAAQPYTVKLEARPDQPFFRLELLGDQSILYLNVCHRFFSAVYSARDTTPRLRAALEVLLFTLGESTTAVAGLRPGLDAGALAAWSAQLDAALTSLEQDRG